jgi:hypothetical protein
VLSQGCRRQHAAVPKRLQIQCYLRAHHSASVFARLLRYVPFRAIARWKRARPGHPGRKEERVSNEGLRVRAPLAARAQGACVSKKEERRKNTAAARPKKEKNRASPQNSKLKTKISLIPDTTRLFFLENSGPEFSSWVGFAACTDLESRCRWRVAFADLGSPKIALENTIELITPTSS